MTRSTIAWRLIAFDSARRTRTSLNGFAASGLPRLVGDARRRRRGAGRGAAGSCATRRSARGDARRSCAAARDRRSARSRSRRARPRAAPRCASGSFGRMRSVTAVPLGPAAPVRVVARELHAIAARELHELERSGADRRLAAVEVLARRRSPRRASRRSARARGPAAAARTAPRSSAAACGGRRSAST